MAGYPGWRWWALGGWFRVTDIPDVGNTNVIMAEVAGNYTNNWVIGMAPSGSQYNFQLFYNKSNRGTSVNYSVGTWQWLVWVMYRDESAELWVDGTRVINRATGAETMAANENISYDSVEITGKTTVNSLWHWDSQFLQDDSGFENADEPLTLNSAGLRVPVLAEAGSDLGSCATGLRSWGGITLTSEFLRGVCLKEDDTSGLQSKTFQFEICNGTTTWDAGFDDNSASSITAKNTVRNRYPTGARWTEALFDAAAFGPRINQVYPLIATVDEGAFDETPPTRYAGIYPG